ncbi:carboxypeptidase-like regulatory domain-containing protein [Natronoflexus pectinivorans]|uniref:Carboxypeptidase-like protein n=1 Tax=Natronoflexus pectinivorans TaxID=682526 RepID=A0A4R2G9W1_9BACT|nr:carboxypeptidase-like regulatory domain-containing protein [Natronoflexus pectinivorans]TCO04431.1 carboxypeptidase-like protein [Natronoflexus pectinivorans]
MRVKILIILTCLALPVISQEFKGKIICYKNGKPIEYVNIGVIGKNLGTVSDQQGFYNLVINKNVTLEDSIQISTIGYKTKVFTLERFKNLDDYNILLSPKSYSIREMQVVAKRRNRIKRFGTPVPSSNLVSLFYDSLNRFRLGQELGVLIDVKNNVLIRTININFGKCSIDSVEMRLNIYKLSSSQEFSNSLQEPIYFSFEKSDIEKELIIDVTEYSIIVSEKVLITVEYFKHSGEGTLGIFAESLPIGMSYFRESSQAQWKTSPFNLGISFYGERIKYIERPSLFPNQMNP